MIQKWSRIRAVIALFGTISILAVAPSPTWAQSPAPSPSPSPSPSWYDGFNARLGYWSGELGLGYMSGQTSMGSSNGVASVSTVSAFNESMRLSNSNFYILSPRLFTGSASLDLQFNQGQTGGSGDTGAMRGEAIGYSFDGAILGDKPYPARVFANLSRNQMLQPFGGLTVGTSETRGAQFTLHNDSIIKDWGYPWFDANLGIREGKSQSVTTSFGRSLSIREQHRTLDFVANKGFETADLRLDYQLNDQIDPDFSQSNFQSNAFNLAYNLDFGPTLNRHFDSKLEYISRNGVSPSTTISNTESLHIGHYQNLSTDYQYGFNQQTSAESSTTAQNGGFTVTHRLYQNLVTSVGVNGNQTTLPNGSTTTYGGSLSQSYSHSLPGKGSFSANWSGGYQLSSNKLSTPSISFTENLRTPACVLSNCLLNNVDDGNGVLLKYPFVVGDLWVVAVSAVGGRRTLVVGTDYIVTAVNNWAKVTPIVIPGIPWFNNPGDMLEVTYKYQVDANLESATTTSAFGMGVDYRWIDVSFGHQQSTPKLLNQATSQFVQSTQKNFARIGLRGSLLKMSTNASLDIESNKAPADANDRVRFDAGLNWEIQPETRLFLNVNASTLKNTLPTQYTTLSRSALSSLTWPNTSLTLGVSSRETRYIWPLQRTDSSLSARSSFNLFWFTGRGWSNMASVSWSGNRENAAPTETLVQASVQSSIRRGKLSLTANLALGEWQRLGSRSTNRSFNISAVRQFR